MISLWIHSLLPLLLFLFDIGLLPEEHEDVEVFTNKAILLTATCSWFCTISLKFSSVFLCKILFSSSSNACLSFSVPKENRRLRESANGRCSVKKVFFFTCFVRKYYSHRRLLFSKIILPEIRAEGICSSRNSAVHVPEINSELVLFAGYSIIWQSPSRYQTTIGSYLLRIEKKSVIFSGSKQIPQRNTMLSQENM